MRKCSSKHGSHILRTGMTTPSLVNALDAACNFKIAIKNKALFANHVMAHFVRNIAFIMAFAFIGLAVAAMGCIIPTTLEAAGETPNQPPIITGGEPDFTANPISSTMDDVLTLRVFASDEDIGDTLKARLFFKNGSSFILQGETTLTPLAKDSPRRAGSFPPAGLCGLAPAILDKLLFVYVSDQPFKDDFDPAHLDPNSSPQAGHFDYKYWVLTCE